MAVHALLSRCYTRRRALGDPSLLPLAHVPLHCNGRASPHAVHAMNARAHGQTQACRAREMDFCMHTPAHHVQEAWHSTTPRSTVHSRTRVHSCALVSLACTIKVHSRHTYPLSTTKQTASKQQANTKSKQHKNLTTSAKHTLLNTPSTLSTLSTPIGITRARRDTGALDVCKDLILCWGAPIQVSKRPQNAFPMPSPCPPHALPMPSPCPNALQMPSKCPPNAL